MAQEVASVADFDAAIKKASQVGLSATGRAARSRLAGRGVRGQRPSMLRARSRPSSSHSSALSPLPYQAVAYFWADWSEPCKQMDAVIAELARRNPAVAFLRVRCASPHAAAFPSLAPSPPS